MPRAEGLFMEDRVMLQALAMSDEPPKDPDRAARLLRRWMHLRLADKPEAHYNHTSDKLGFLAWLLRDVGDKAYKFVKQTHPEEAAEIRRQVLVICFTIANTCERMSGLGMMMHLAKQHAEVARMFPETALGAEDAEF